jgi:hypothetical protein
MRINLHSLDLAAVFCRDRQFFSDILFEPRTTGGIELRDCRSTKLELVQIGTETLSRRCCTVAGIEQLCLGPSTPQQSGDDCTACGIPQVELSRGACKISGVEVSEHRGSPEGTGADFEHEIDERIPPMPSPLLMGIMPREINRELARQA